ncbi:nickel pincer cofactor biosynthesis protein LarC [Stenomitos frigidus]|uniref:Putative nickel insertion protein n=1 Tax=Stenomitos frigidus ULC18 TaxID=2107698 RepID=A0A2T1DXY0_9CYAN|nr:nickel pincer cofactor biosynthesis protein LarC [Stenomitos frigidus]PSB25340.1 nickel pincer cofactor biosynthesis protein LarC [Stenomitos frigidus ULC18]
MTKIAYLDCPTGIAGDMCLGALVHAGVPLDYLIAKLSQLGIEKEYQLRAERVNRNGQQATKVHVDLLLDAAMHDETAAIASSNTAPRASHDHTYSATERVAATETDGAQSHSHSHDPSHSHSHSHHPSVITDEHTHHELVRHLPEVEHLILAAGLPAQAETWSLAVFRKLAEAEGAIHGVPPEQVHFHEVGATDAIVDIVGTCLGLDWLGIDRLYCSPLPTGGGTIRAAHGRLPVPAPAVLKLFELRQVPLYSNGIDREMVTPTGAAIATTLATQFGSPPPMTLHRVGLGAGSISLPLPNILRLWIGEAGEGEGSQRSAVSGQRSAVSNRDQLKTQNSKLKTSSHPIALLETQIDDLNPQAIGYLYEALFAVGALDVFTQAIGMKKSRPGILLTIVCHPEAVAACEAVMFRETTTLGIRRSIQERTALHREMQSVQTEYGTVQVKVAWLDRSQLEPTNVQPEYEDCARLARQHQLPWRDVHRLALEAWYAHHSKASSGV